MGEGNQGSKPVNIELLGPSSDGLSVWRITTVDFVAIIAQNPKGGDIAIIHKEAL